MAKDTKDQKVITRKAQSHLNRERTQRKYLLMGVSVIGVLIAGIIIFGLVHEFLLKPHEPVAKVDGQEISTQEFQIRVKYQRWQIIQQYISTIQQSQMFAGNESLASYFENTLTQMAAQLDDVEGVGEEVLNQMIDEVVIIQEAEARGYAISDAELNEKIETLFGYYAKGTPTSAPTSTVVVTSTYSPTQEALIADESEETPTAIASEEEATPTAEQEATETVEPSPYPTSTPITSEGYQELKQSYFEQIADLDFSEENLKTMVKADMLREKVFDEVTADIATEEERVWARHILVEDEETANEVLEQLNNGTSFSDLAAEYSTDTSNKDTGGDLGWFGKGQMVEEFEKVAFDLQIGEFSEPVQTSFGFHIIQVLGHEMRPLSESELQTEQQKVYDEWFEGIKSQKTIETYDRWKERVPAEPEISPELLMSGAY